MNHKSAKKKAPPPRVQKPVVVMEQPPILELGDKSPVKESLGGKPRFVRCQLIGPDGRTRPGWEMWLGEHCFGKADQKDILLKSLERQQQPPQSFHWREVHRQRFDRAQGPKNEKK